MSYDESELTEDLGFKLFGDEEEDEDLATEPDDFKFDEDEELEDPEDKFH